RGSFSGENSVIFNWITISRCDGDFSQRPRFTRVSMQLAARAASRTSCSHVCFAFQPLVATPVETAVFAMRT
ncbi:hypothetical protein TSAR_008001, partial [Trichomalopsis sarcophagae]